MPGLELLISAFAGLVSGTIASLIAPWVNWRIERVRQRSEYRRQQIKRWREAIHAFDFENQNFADTVVYAEIRPYLDEEYRRGLESGRVHVVPPRGRGESYLKHKVLDTIAECERRWRLI